MIINSGILQVQELMKMKDGMAGLVDISPISSMHSFGDGLESKTGAVRSPSVDPMVEECIAISEKVWEWSEQKNEECYLEKEDC